MKELIIDNTTYRIGQNASDNTQLIKDSNINWYWFHLDKFPSAHVVICKEEINNLEINQAGLLIKEYSKYKFKNIGICYCKIDNLILGKEPGSVLFRFNKQVNIFNL